MRFVLMAVLTGCGPLVPTGDPAVDDAVEPLALTTLIYTAGPAWDATLPPEQQDLGDHFVFVGERFVEGQLLAYGPFLDDGRGFYVFDAEEAPDLDEVVAEDPGATSGVLAVDEIGEWSVLLEQLDAPADALFVLEYPPGPSWPAGDILFDLDLADHQAYWGDRFAEGVLLMGGPVSDLLGRYVVGAADIVAAQALVDADPAVVDGLFSPQVKPWGVLQRQGPQ